MQQFLVQKVTNFPSEPFSHVIILSLLKVDYLSGICLRTFYFTMANFIDFDLSKMRTAVAVIYRYFHIKLTFSFDWFHYYYYCWANVSFWPEFVLALHRLRGHICPFQFISFYRFHKSFNQPMSASIHLEHSMKNILRTQFCIYKIR